MDFLRGAVCGSCEGRRDDFRAVVGMEAIPFAAYF